MKTVNLCLLVSCGLGTALAASGCLQDYDQFEFGAGGAPPTTSAQSTAGPGPATTGPGQTTNTTATSTVGPTTTNTTNTTADTTTVSTVASTAMSSTSSGPVIDCSGDECDIDAGETCCVDGSQNGSCSNGACGADIPVDCDSAADCDVGEVCCLHESNGNTQSVTCETACTGFDNDPLCGGDGDAACASPTNCTDVDDLPGGYQSCQ